MMFTNAITKEVNMSDSRATMISLGGHLGTWQGIGWTIVGNSEGSTVIGTGEILGLAGITASALLTNRFDFSTGHAELTSSGLPWGAWFGMVLGGMAKMNGDNILRSMLLGSDVMVLGTALAAKNVQMSKTRVRLINMAGALGAVFGFGVNLLFEVDDASAAFAIAGASSIAGLIIGRNMTRNFDKGKEVTLLKLKKNFAYKNGNGGKRFMISPKLSLLQYPVERNRYIPAAGLQFDF
ncbi:MAG TPA: hypothetical protein ENH29_05570 [Bacteroidetes bacterium]|nr:hypothetical protein [Bacteroidota bacterium]